MWESWGQLCNFWRQSIHTSSKLDIGSYVYATNAETFTTNLLIFPIILKFWMQPALFKDIPLQDKHLFMTTEQG